MDPIDIDSPYINEISNQIQNAIKALNIGDFDYHEIRTVHPFNKTRKVVFDLVVSPDNKLPYQQIIAMFNEYFSTLEQPFIAVIIPEENFFE
jgi:hypothetical protein